MGSCLREGSSNSKKVKYVLVVVDYDECETEKLEFESMDKLVAYFGDDADCYGSLFNEGFYDWEWGSYQLIYLGDYQ